MKKLLITSFFSLALFSVASAQSLAEDVLSMKKEMKDGLVRHQTEVVEYGAKPVKLSIDVTGWKTLSLRSWETENGRSYDQSAWGGAVLIKKDGTKVWVSDMDYVYSNTPYGLPKRDMGFSNGPIVIGGETFERGVTMHAPSELAVNINGEFVRFEATVGIEDSSRRPGSVSFIVQNLNTNAMVEQLIANYPKEVGALTNIGRVNPEKWITTDDCSVEKQAALTAAKLIKGGEYTKMVEAVDGTKEEKMAQYLDIVADIQRIIDIQNRYAFFNLENVIRAFEDMSESSDYDVAKFETRVMELERLAEKRLDLSTGDKSAVAKAEKILELSRELLLSNTALDNNKIILSRYRLGSKARSAAAPLIGTQNNNWSNQLSSSRLGFDAEISEMSNLRAETPTYKTIYKPAKSNPVSDLMLHWDADRILFTSVNDRNLWSVFEVGVDGKGAREVIKTDEPDLEFTDGTFLPSGKFIATSNIGYHGVPCVHGTDPVGNMVLYDPKDESLRRITFDQDANWHPVVANNGKVMYVRWEYTDLTHYFSRITMHMNPDGTEQKALYGSGGFFPNSTFDIQPLPGNTSKFIGVISGHHGVARSGRLMLFDPAKSRKKLDGIVQEIPFSKRKIDPIIRDGLVNGVWPQFLKPRPVNDKYFLVTAKLTANSLWGIYLVDIYDNMTLIAEDEGAGYINAIYVQKRETPPAIPDRVNLEDKESTVYIQDIYEGEGLPGVPRGTVKKLRLFAYEYAYVNSPSNHIAQGIQSGWDIKRLLGEVDVNEDGSAIFKVPANTPISIQPLDSEGQALQWMRSWFTGMPGEVVSCVGCHEDQNMMPLTKQSMASKQKPQSIVEWDGGVRPYTFELEVQPVLDRACVACHNEKSKLSFVGGTYDDYIKSGDMVFSKSYLNLHPYVNRQGPEADALVMKPYEYHASTSELIRILKNGHHGVELTDKEWRSLYAWIDMNAPYHSKFVQRDHNGFNQICRRQELQKKYGNVDVNWEQEIEDYAAYLKSKGAITPVMPKAESAPKYKNVKSKAWPFTAQVAADMQSKLGETRKEIDLGEGVKIVLRKIPAGEFIMGDNTYGKESAPEAKVKIAKPFWIGEMEITNEQYKALVPEHDSRYMAQFWKDHTGPGYEANRPGQPVIRVSYNQVIEYCKMLSEKSGLNVTLPTEAQWEWAARAGSDKAFWFGDLSSDFGQYENLADVQLEKMAVAGVNPRPMGKGPMFDLYNFLPKSADVDDKSMHQTEGKSYEANPWGLYDMLGNVREWTTSDYKPYPFKVSKKPEVADDKVVRGGSWIDRAKFSAVYSRKSAKAWQPLNNVGFRVVVIEE